MINKEQKYKGLKIAHIAAKGADGCGVQRTSAESIIWAKKVGAIVDYYAYDKKFGRSAGHEMDIKTFNMKNMKKTVDYINDNYDIVMFMNYPSNKHDNTYQKAFYYNFFLNINKPIKAVFIHDIHKGQIDKTPYLVPILYNADVVFHFDIDTWFSKTVDELGIKKINDRLFKYTLWMNFDDLDQWRQRYLNKKKKGLVSVTRWSSLKNVRRTIDIIDSLQKKKVDWDCAIYGIERSIGAKFDIIDYEKTRYNNTSGKIDNEEQGTVNVYGPIIRNKGIEKVAEHMFSSSFFSLPKLPQNYGNRMEYSQIEIIGVGTIPVFDKHWAENNSLKDGRKYIDIPYSGVYTDGTNIEEVSDKLIEISENKDLMQKYIDTSYEIVKEEFDADIIIPNTIDLINRVGKNKNQKTVYEICEELVNKEFADGIKEIEDLGKIPVLGIGEIENPTLFFMNGAKQEILRKIKKSKKNKNVKALF